MNNSEISVQAVRTKSTRTENFSNSFSHQVQVKNFLYVFIQFVQANVSVLYVYSLCAFPYYFKRQNYGYFVKQKQNVDKIINWPKKLPSVIVDICSFQHCTLVFV